MKYYLIAGEASGDLHGANLMKEIKKLDSKASFRFWGGSAMQKVADTLPVKSIDQLAFMGFIEVIFNLKTIIKNIAFCKKDILQFNPDKVIFIDYPGFNLKIAPFAKKNNFETIWYISPQIWAWKEKRVLKIKKYINHMICILPFEPAFYHKYNYTQVSYVGHPLLDTIPDLVRTPLKEKSLHKVALLPGSRMQEINRSLPIFIAVANQMPHCQFIVAGLSHLGEAFYKQFPLPTNIVLWFDKTYEILQNSDAALVTSGTATLETALFKVPQVVCYSANSFSYHIAKLLIKVRYISLINLIMNQSVIPELIQKDFNVKKCLSALHSLAETEVRNLMKTQYELLRKVLGNEGASQKAAEIIVNQEKE